MFRTSSFFWRLLPELLLAAWALAAIPAAAQQCPGGKAILRFQLTAAPQTGGQPLALTEINDLGPSDVIQYASSNPGLLNSARVSIMVVPREGDFSSDLRVLPARKARKPAQWNSPVHAAAVAFIYGPHGFNTKKIRKLANSHPELIRALIDYAIQASRVEALVTLLEHYEQSPPGSENLNTLLQQYSNRYGVKLPKVNPNMPSDVEAAQLLQAITPPSEENQVNPNRRAIVTGAATASQVLGGMFLSPETTIAAGTVPLFNAIRHNFFPGTEFLGSFGEPGPGANETSLCTTNIAPNGKKHLAYIWIILVPGDAAPTMRLQAKQTIPVQWKDSVHVVCATVAQQRALMRARDWQLIGADGHAVPVSVKIHIGATDDSLGLDLRHLALAPGNYHLRAVWDWTPIQAQGTIHLAPLPNLAKIKLAPGTGDQLIASGGIVKIKLLGANSDAAFFKSVELLPAAKNSGLQPKSLPFTAQPGNILQVPLDTAGLQPGEYKLRLLQINGSQREIPITVHPPNPVLQSLPIRVNLGETAPQAIVLHGQHLERITAITSPGAQWSLAQVAKGSAGLTERQATVTLASGASAGTAIAATVTVKGLKTPLTIADALRVAGPRPRIARIVRATTGAAPVQLFPGELALNRVSSFSIVLEHAPQDPEFDLSCLAGPTPDTTVHLHPGEQRKMEDLEAAGGSDYYLALKPADLGQSGCSVQLRVVSPANGDSAPVVLGRTVQLPTITRFTLSDKSTGPNLYAGVLTGNDLQLIAAVGWDPHRPVLVDSIPLPLGKETKNGVPEQRLHIILPWPAPSPHAHLYIWLRGEKTGRQTNATL